jgi:GAF domain-containing protein
MSDDSRPLDHLVFCDYRSLELHEARRCFERLLVDPLAVRARRALLQALGSACYRPPTGSLLDEDLRRRILEEGVRGGSLDHETLCRVACDGDALQVLHDSIWAAEGGGSCWEELLEEFCHSAERTALAEGSIESETRPGGPGSSHPGPEATDAGAGTATREATDRAASRPCGHRVSHAIAVKLQKLEDRLEKEGDVYKRLKLILNACRKVLRGAYAGDISVVPAGAPPEKSRWLRVVARAGKGVNRMPYFVPAGVGISGRVMRSGKTAVVSRTLGDEDFQVAISDGNPVAELYPEERWRPYLEFLQGIRSALKVPLKRCGKVLGVLCLHGDVEGEFDADAVALVEAFARRAAIEVSNLLEAEELAARCESGPASAEALLALTAQLGAEVQATCPPSLPETAARLAGGRPAWPDGLGDRRAPQPPGEKLREVGKQLAETAVTHTGAYRAAVRLIGPDYKSLVVLGIAGKEGAWPDEFLSTPVAVGENTDTAAGHAIASRQSYYLPDTAQKYTWEGDRLVHTHYRPVAPEARSHASVLLRHEGHLLGVLSVDWDRPGACDDGRTRQSLERLAGQYGIVLKAYSTDALFARLDGFLDDAAREGLKPDSREFLRIVAEFLRIVAEMVGARQGAIFLRRPHTGHYHAVASLVHDDWSEETHFYPPGEGVTGWVLEHNRSVRIADLRDAKELHDICPDDPPVWADRHCDGKDRNDRNYTYLAVPIAVGDQVFGVIRVADSKFGCVAHSKFGFTCYDQKILEAAASRLAGLLDQQEQTRRTNGLIRLASFIATTKSQKELAAGLFEILAQVIGDCTCWVRLLDTLRRGTDSWPVLTRLAVSPRSWEPLTPRFRRLGEGIAGRTVQRKGMLRLDYPTFDDAAQDTLAAAIIAEDPANRELLQTFRSIACVPLRTETEVVGTLLVCRQNYRALCPGDLSFIRDVAHMAGPYLKKVGEDEVKTMKEKLLEAKNAFLTGYFRGDGARESERQLLAEVCTLLKEGLGGKGVAVWVFDREDAAFHCQWSMGLDDCPLPAMSQSWVVGQLRDYTCPELLVSEPESDRRLIQFLEPGGPACQKAVEGCQGALIKIDAGGQSVALFLVVGGPLDQISHTRVREVEQMLRGLAIDIVWRRVREAADSASAAPKVDPRRSRQRTGDS